MYQPSLFIPESSWIPPSGPLPDLRGSEPVAVDLETRDEGLATERGPGWVYNWGHIAGVAVARGDWSAYYPVRHPDTDCRPLEDIIRWLGQLFDSETPVVFHNAPYDLGWLRQSGLTRTPRNLHDTHAIAVMLDENRLSYSLNNLSIAYGREGKNKFLLDEAAAAFGATSPDETGSFIWRLPAKFVGPYAEGDTIETLELFKIMVPLLKASGAWDAYILERDLIPVFVEMRDRGIRISEDAAEQAQKKLRVQLRELMDELDSKTGVRNSVHSIKSPDALQRLFDDQGVPYPKTPKTQKGSFKKDWMKNAEHWLPKTIMQLRQLDDLAEKFIGTFILDFSQLGRLHPEVHQLRDDDGGTRSYRISYSNPPLQQMPARDPILAPLIREIFRPEDGELWAALDYKQQEPRMAVHFASLCQEKGAEDAVAYYVNDPKADFHTMVAELAGISRSDAKIINLGLMYGMGIGKLAASLGLTIDDAKLLLEQYNDRLPWVSGLSNTCKKRADAKGVIRLIDGALCHFDRWEPSWRGDEEEKYVAPKTFDEAKTQWPKARLKRAFTHKSMNRLVQGSSARQTKRAMLHCAREGMLPLIQMHDELGFSLGSEAQIRHAAQIMCDAIPLVVPVYVDMEVGPSWGSVKAI